MHNNYKNLKGAGKPKPRPLGRLGLLLSLLLILTILISLVPKQKVEAQGSTLTVPVPVGQAFFKKGVNPEPTGPGAKKPDPDPKGNGYTVDYQMTFIDGPNNSGLGPMPWNSKDKSYTFKVKGNQDDFTLQLNFNPHMDSPGIYNYMLEISPDQADQRIKDYHLDASRYICRIKVLNDPLPGKGLKLAGFAFLKEGEPEPKAGEAKRELICFNHLALAGQPTQPKNPKGSNKDGGGGKGNGGSGKGNKGKPDYVGDKGGAPRTGETYMMTFISASLLLLTLVLIVLRRYKAKNK